MAVDQIREIRDQLKARNEALKGMPAATELVSKSLALVVKLDSLEARIHNPEAEVTYDILAFRGGAKLYSRLTPLYMWSTETGAPTQGMKEVYASQRQELDSHLQALRALIDGDLAAINALATKLNLAHIIVPAKPQVP